MGSYWPALVLVSCTGCHAPKVRAPIAPVGEVVESGERDAPVEDLASECFARPVTYSSDLADLVPFARTPAADVLGIDCAEHPRPVDCQYVVGMRLFHAHRFVEAAPLLREVAYEAAGHARGANATRAYLDCLNLVGGHAEPPRIPCYQYAASEVPALEELYCAPAHASPSSTALCPVLSEIRVGIARQHAERLSERGDVSFDRGDKGRAWALYREAGTAYQRILDVDCGPGDRRYQRCDEIAYNALRCWRMVGNHVAAEQTCERFFDDPTESRRSPLAAEMGRECTLLVPRRPAAVRTPHESVRR